MSFLGKVVGAVFRALSDKGVPNEVLEEQFNKYQKQEVIATENGLYVFNANSNYEIILHDQNKQKHCFSLHRSLNRFEATSFFSQLVGKMLPILEITKAYNKISLQNICDCVREHPNWSIAHIAAYLDLVICFQHNLIRSQINEMCYPEEMTPLHVAIKYSKLESIKALINMDVRLDIVDCKGNTVFHYAAESDGKIIHILGARKTAMINCFNINNLTPLHVACKSNKADCVAALLQCDANANITKDACYPIHLAVKENNVSCIKALCSVYPQQVSLRDLKHNGTPMHWIKSRKGVSVLAKRSCDLEACSNTGHTALHIMILYKRLECVISLLCFGANVNARTNNGDTPLHLAVSMASIPLVQTLIVFSADINNMNNMGETPRHLAAACNKSERDGLLYVLHSVGARRCPPNVPKCNLGCKPDGQDNGKIEAEQHKPVEFSAYDQMFAAMVASAANEYSLLGSVVDSPRSRQYDRILCLDGGGIRGLLTIQILLAIEKASQKPVIHCFDWIGGTSTGGILALALAAGKTVEECRCMYLRMKDKVFKGQRPYASEPLEKLLKKEFGQRTMMDIRQPPRVVVTGVLADRKPTELHLFRNYEPPPSATIVNNDYKPVPHPREQPIWRAARSSGAAPTYFRPMGRFLDGGLISNNPTLDVLTEINTYHLTQKLEGKTDDIHPLGIVLSLGTGLQPLSKVTCLDVFQPESILDLTKMAFGMHELATILVDEVTASDGHIVNRARAWCNMINVPYFRLNPQMSRHIPLDTTDNEILMRMLWETSVYLYENRDRIQEIAALLAR